MRSACALSAASGSGVSVTPMMRAASMSPGSIGLGGKREHPPLALGRACFFERATRERRDRLACNAGAAADADGDNSTRGLPAHGLTNRHCTIGIAARQPE